MPTKRPYPLTMDMVSFFIHMGSVSFTRHAVNTQSTLYKLMALSAGVC
jgi:hypothetical protein